MSQDTPDHMITSYGREFQNLKGLLTEMGGLVENQLSLSVQGLTTRNSEMARNAVAEDRRVDALERDIEGFVIRMLALRQPMASDLRHIVGALKITGALERIGDYAANVAKRSIVLSESMLPNGMSGIVTITRLVQRNLKSIVDAIGSDDIEACVAVWNSDQEIDDAYNAMFRELVTYMMEDPRNITPCTHLLFIAKNLERIGDHATNIAETVYYAVTGETLPQARPKGMPSV